MEAVTAVVAVAVIMAAAIVGVVMVTAIISAGGIMAAVIFMPDRRVPVHSPLTVHSPRIA
ncbi:small-conductance mechanosensitive channel [Bradyrhizobium sp. AZCC 1610]